MTNLTLRTLTPADASAYRALRLAGLHAFPDVFQPDYEEALAQPLSWSEKRLAKPGDTFFGAFADDALVGAVCLRRYAGRKIGHVAELKALVVDPQRQSQGIGRGLMAHLIDHARALACIRTITLTLIDGNTRAARLYDAFGFRQFGLEPDAFLHDGRYHAKQHRQLILQDRHHEQ
jgi:GNAT superfamily N-acetyltransferase